MPDPDRLCLLQVHAHPDDEASKGAGTTAKYAAEGVRNVLVCCTGGEAGDILNPAVDTPENRANLYEVRMAELQASVDALGYASLHMLGYHDSGMPDTEPNARPDNFANAPLDEAVERFVRIIRAERPQVIITYHDEQNFYPHPDHIRVHEISGPAFDAAGDPDAFPDAGDPWQPSKLYYVSWSIARVKALHEAYLARGEESAYTSWFERGFDTNRKDEFTTLIDVGDFLYKRRESLLAHRTQVDPERALDAAPRRRDPRGVPVGGVHARALAGRQRRSRGRVRRRSLRRPARRCGRSCLTVVVEFVVAAGKKEQARGWVRVGDDAVVDRGDGAPPKPADITFTATPADAQLMHDGTLDLSVGFMRGQVKMAGDFGALLHFLPVTSGADARLVLGDLLPN